MADFSHLSIYILLFIALYFEVFMLITYVENRDDLKKEDGDTLRLPRRYPSVSIIVPCWNEEQTLARTVNSLLNLDYPKDKLDIFIVDDGSTDGTWEMMQRFITDPTLPNTASRDEKFRVQIFQKPNGGKHTALNFALEKITSELVGCLDADSYAHKDALKNIIIGFENDAEAMAITPSVKIWEPKSIIQMIQSVEYIWAIFLRKMLAYMGAIYVTPGPFSIFKREVFAQVGPYREAHKTEDMEMAMRMQAHAMKIGNSHNATIYTSGPENLKKLYKQRLRWTYGFIKNAADYRFMFFKKKYGNLGLFVLPIALLSIFATVYATGVTIVGLASKIRDQIIQIQTVGLHFSQLFHFNFDWFYVNTELLAIVSLVSFLGTILILLMSRKLSLGKIRFGWDMLYFVAIYSFIAPLWLGKAVFNALFSITTNWR